MSLTTLKNIYKEKGNDFIKKLFKSYVIVSEQIDGSRFMFQKQFDDSLTFYKKTGVTINHIDRTLMMFYEKAINYISGLDKTSLDKIPDNWTFGFKYFPSLAPNNIIYNKLPKNNLILTDISIRNDNGRVIKVISDPKILKEWAETLNIEHPPIIFQGYLSDNQKEQIEDYLKTEEDELRTIFKTKSFTRYIISIINPKLKNTALSDSLDNDIEGIVFKFIEPTKSDYYSAKVVDPIFQYNKKHLKSNKPRKSNDMYQISMLDIVEFIEQYDFKKIKLKAESQEERYVELICSLFNDYISLNGHKYVGINFDIPDFAKRKEFNINLHNIKNSRTKEILNNDYMSNLYKIMLSSFRKYRKNPTNILTEVTIKSINSIVDKFEKMISVKSNTNETLDFTTLMKQQKYAGEKSMFEQEIFEGLTINYPKQGLKKVNIVAGRYQPFTKGHIKVFKELYKQNGYPIVICIVRGKKSNMEKNPFSEDLQLAMFSSLQKQFKFLEAAVTISNAAIDSIYNELRPTYEPVLWGAGSDRIKSYDNMVNKYREELDSLPEFQMHEIKRTDSNISASKVREALKIEDEKTFNSFTPKSIHKFYDELKEILVVNNVVVEYTEYINEATTPITPSPDELANILSSGKKFTDNVLNKIAILLNIDNEAEDKISEFLKNIQIPDNNIEEMSNAILSYPKSDKFIDYIYNRKLNMSKMLNKSINIVDIFTSQGIDKKLIEWLINYRWPASPIIGPAEIALAVLLENGLRPGRGQSGDLIVNNTPIEVKGTGGRLRGQSGYSEGRSFKVAVVEAFKNLSMSHKLEPNDIPSDISGKDDLYYNFTGKNWGVEKQSMRIIEETGNKITSNDIAEVISHGIKAIYHGIDMKETTKWVNKYISKDGSIDRSLLDEFFIKSFEYYASVDDFTHIMITDKKGNVVTIKNSDFRKNVGKTIKYGVPSFGDKAGPQGMAFSIALK